MILSVGVILLVVAGSMGLSVLGWKLVRSGSRSAEIRLPLRAFYVLVGCSLLIIAIVGSFFSVEMLSKMIFWGK